MSSGLLEPKLVLSDDAARQLAIEFGTPLYVFSEQVFRERIRAYTQAFSQVEQNFALGYASKANSTLAVLKIASQEGCLIDVASEGEFRAALAAGIPGDRCYMHGNNKSKAEICFALDNNIDHIVVDNFAELEALANLQTKVKVVLRFAPGVDPVTHKKIRTGQNDTKFGFPVEAEVIDRAASFVKEHGVNFYGLHCHVGSQLMDHEAQLTGGTILADVAKRFQDHHGLTTQLLNIGGGLGVSYIPEQQPLSLTDFNKAVIPPVRSRLNAVNPDATLMQEPGRSVAADAGVTLYRVGALKPVNVETGPKTFVVVDGGLADNPRPGLYSADYSMTAVPAESRANAPLNTFTIAGRHCETDILFPDVELRNDVQPGDLIQIQTTGAYNSSMASNYNRYRRPATVLLRTDGTSQIVQRPESWEEMIARDQLPEDL